MFMRRRRMYPKRRLFHFPNKDSIQGNDREKKRVMASHHNLSKKK
jgi:hypothetical protein